MHTIAKDNLMDVALADRTLGQLAAEDLRTVSIFKKYNLDFCCGGKKTVREACAEKGLELERVEQEIMAADKTPSVRPLPYNEWSLDFLCDYIVNTHHTYVKKTLPELQFFANKVARVHGKAHPELLDIQELVEETAAEMTDHMMKEEQVLFPYIKALQNAQNGEPAYDAPFGSVRNPVSMMESEHEQVGANMEQIRTLSNNYALPEGACATYSVLFRMLEEFEGDLHLHVHLENNILFPKAIELERNKKGR